MIWKMLPAKLSFRSLVYKSELQIYIGMQVFLKVELSKRERVQTNFFQAAFFSRIIFNILKGRVGVRELTSLTVLKEEFFSISAENLEANSCQAWLMVSAREKIRDQSMRFKSAVKATRSHLLKSDWRLMTDRGNMKLRVFNYTF